MRGPALIFDPPDSLLSEFVKLKAILEDFIIKAADVGESCSFRQMLSVLLESIR